MDKLYIVLLIAVLAILAGGLLTLRVQQASPGGDKLRWAAGALRRAALPFAIRASISLGALGIILFLLFAFIPGLSLRLAFSALFGIAASLLAAHVSMHAGIRAITQAAAATRSPSIAVRKALAAGAAGGFTAAGIALLALAALVMVFAHGAEAAVLGESLLQNLAGFVLGSCAVAIAFRCGGGITSQAAAMAQSSAPGDIQPDVGAAKNPAEICAIACESISGLGGLAAEYCTALSASLVAAMMLGIVALKSSLGAAFPLLIASAGVSASLLAMLWVFRSPAQKPLSAARAGQLVATMLMLLLALAISLLSHIPTGMFLAVLFGAAAGGAIALVDDYYANPRLPKLAAASNSIGGWWGFLDALWVGARSALFPVIVIAVTAVGAFAACGGLKEPARGMFGLALAAIGAIAAGAYRVASLSSACILKQAARIAPVAGLDEGNIATLNAIQDKLPCACHVRGHSVVAFALAGLGLYAAFTHSANLPTSDLNQPLVLGGLLIGAALPLWSAAGCLRATKLAVKSLIAEARRQFAEIPGLAEGQAEGNYERCSEIAAAHSLRELGYTSLTLVAAVVILGAAFRLLKAWLYAGTRSAGGGELAAGMIAGAVLFSLVVGLVIAGLAATAGSSRQSGSGETADIASTASLGAAIAGAAAPMLMLAPILLASAALAFASWLR